MGCIARIALLGDVASAALTDMLIGGAERRNLSNVRT